MPFLALCQVLLEVRVIDGVPDDQKPKQDVCRHERKSRRAKKALNNPITNHSNTGTCNVIVGHPIDLVKVRQQTQLAAPAAVVPSSSSTTSSRLVAPPPARSTVGMLRHIALYEGVAGLYAGVTAPLLAVVPAFAISFGAYETARQAQLAHANNHNAQPSSTTTKSELSLTQTAIAGGFSGVPLAAVVGPLDRIKCLMQVHPTRYSGFVDCAQKVYAEGGWRSCLRGTGVTLLRDVPGNAAYFATYEVVKRSFYATVQEPSSASTTLMTLFAGGMSGVMNWIVAIPMDVVKSRWQTAQPGTYSGPPHVLRVLLETEGPQALFRGLGPALMRAFPANAACLLGFETATAVLKKTLGDGI